MSVLSILNTLRVSGVFPSVVGDQLKLAGDTKGLSAEFIEQVRASRNELIAFLQGATGQELADPIVPVAAQDAYPASNAQQRVWALSQFEGGGEAYNIVTSLLLKGNVAVEKLNQAFGLAVHRHESLRTVFRTLAGEPYQVVLAHLPFTIDYHDVSQRADLPDFLQTQVEGAARWKFDLENGPLLRVDLFKVAEETFAMVFGMHHIVSDGWSINVLIGEVLGAYEALCYNRVYAPAPLGIHYKDYAHWLRNWVEGEKAERARNFWQGELVVDELPLQLPYDFPRPAMRSYEGAVARFYLDPEQHQRVQAFCQQHHATLFNFFRAALSVLLHKLSGQRYICIGTPVSGRNHHELENQIGLYVNTLPLQAHIIPEASWLETLKVVSENSIAAFRYQSYPLDRLVEEVGGKRDPGRNPLFDVMMVLQDTALGQRTHRTQGPAGFELSYLATYLHGATQGKTQRRPAKCDLTFNFDAEPGGRHFLELEYSTQLFAPETIEGVFVAYTHLIDQALATPAAPVAAMQVVGARERHQLLAEFNQPVLPITEPSLLVLLTEQLRSGGQRPALLYGERRVSYAELDTHSERVAHYLRQLVAGLPNQSARVGLLIGRSEWLVISILGVLKAGLAYVPIDVQYPAERIQYMLHDAQPAILVVDDEGLGRQPADFTGTIVHLDMLRALPPEVAPAPPAADWRENPAYIIYTSGSTGRPKGVQITHRNVTAFLKWALAEFDQTPFQTLYAATSYCFDLSVFEFLFPLCTGKVIRILDSALQIPQYVCTDSAVLLNTVPSVVKHLLETGMDWTAVVALNMAGEAVPKALEDDLAFLPAEIRNLYGPTEDTTYSTVYRFGPRTYEAIPIGKPIGFTRLYILDAAQNLLPAGVAGEIYLSGQGVASGYLNQPALTAEKFLPDPFARGLRMYRTGDFGKWLRDGNVAFLGRADDQVKIRGNRVELGEVQYALERVPGVRRAAVVVRPVNQELQIVAYWVGAASLTAASLRDELARQLPAAMLPSSFVALDELPLNANGKLDKARLPAPTPAVAAVRLEPRNPLERQLTVLWQEVLGHPAFSVEEDFFALGGHSLKAIKLKYLIASRMDLELTLDELFAHPTVAGQATLLGGRAATRPLIIPRAPEQPAYAISSAQERLWVLTSFDEASRAYHMPAAFEVLGKLHVQRLQQAFQLVIERHEILRTLFAGTGDQLTQVVLPTAQVAFTLEEVVLDDLPEPALHAYLQQRWQEPFDLRRDLLLRAFVLTTPSRQLFSFTMHHLIGDGWSLEVLYSDLLSAYNRLGVDPEATLPRLGFQYRDYAEWQRTAAGHARLAEGLAFWKGMFSDGVPVLELPTDFFRPEVKTYRGGTVRHRFGPAALVQLHTLARQANTTLFTTLLAGVNVLLKKYSNQNQLVVGTPVAGRQHAQLDNQIGLYVNTLAIKTELDGELPFSVLLARQQEILRACFAHQEFPFEQLVEELQLKRDLSRAPLFDVLVVLQNAADLEGERQLAPGLRLRRLDLASGTAKYDCTFSFTETAGDLLLELEYNADLFDVRTIEQMTRHLGRLFEQVLACPDTRLKDIDLLDAAEHAVLAAKADRTAVGYDTTATLVSLFGEAAARHASRPAVVDGERQLTYRELDEQSSRLAGVLVREHGVASQDLVCLYFERNHWMLVAILAVLKAGAAYVPIDPAYPAARISYILGDSAGRLVLGDTRPDALAEAWPAKTFLDITRLPYDKPGLVAQVQARDLAYVIYTSGTTGNPKGVLIEHENVTRLLFNNAPAYDFGSADRWPLFHSYCFDVSVWEMYGALLNGGTLVVVPRETAQDSLRFYDFLLEQRITVLNQTPTAFRSLVQHNRRRFGSAPPSTIRYVIFAGEALKPETLREWHEALPACKLINMYGITETTVHVTYREITQAEILDNKSVIGEPLPTLSCYVLDADLQQVPVGVIGELCVGGAGLARGYLNQPDLTAERFIAHPQQPGQRLYRSGDYARILPDGDIEYIGRRDDQVKIRGHRIEVAEVETALTRLPGIKDAVVLPVRNASEEYDLVAYYIPEDDLPVPDLRQALAALLPAYMVPSFLMPLSAFPLNSNGKLDKRALPQPQPAASQPAGYAAPRNETDQQLISIWESVLETSPIGLTDNFFDLGGHSLKATRVISKIHEAYGIKIDLKDLFLDPTVQHLSDYIDTVRWMESQKESVLNSESEIIF
jgi:amino acid adenylation domain-containing protein